MLGWEPPYNLFGPPFGGCSYVDGCVGRGGGKAKEKARLLEKLFIQRREDYSHHKHVIQHAYLLYVSYEDAKICGY